MLSEITIVNIILLLMDENINMDQPEYMKFIFSVYNDRNNLIMNKFKYSTFYVMYL